MRVAVETYSGFKADERPVRFRLGERWLAVEEVADRWYEPEAVYFKVRAEDGGHYILRREQSGGDEEAWTLVSYRR